MISHQRPGIDRRPGFRSHGSKSSHKICSVRLAIASNPAQKGQLKRNKSFASLFDDAEFQRLIK